ncbi:MAG TPA: Flp family type IVb pilin [Nocardioides sp.]|nr:Flp family type IVb pilin [Nocardioides sp.]
MTGNRDGATGDTAVRQDRGATAVEYALMAMLIAGVLIGVIGWFGQDVQWLFASVNW